MPRKKTKTDTYLSSIYKRYSLAKKAYKEKDDKELKRQCAAIIDITKKLEDYVLERQIEKTALKQLPLNLK